MGNGRQYITADLFITHVRYKFQELIKNDLPLQRTVALANRGKTSEAVTGRRKIAETIS